MKIAGLIGEPACGKTTIARELLKLLSKGEPFKSGLLNGTFHRFENTYVLGRYEPGEVFAGTDRLSMGVQPHAERFLHGISIGDSVFFEGDRLGNLKFLKACAEVTGGNDLRLFTPDVTPELIAERHKKRADTQSESFLKGRRTKLENIAKEFNIRMLPNRDPSDAIYAARAIYNFLK